MAVHDSSSGDNANEVGYRVTYVQALQEIRGDVQIMRGTVDKLDRLVTRVVEENVDLKKRVRALELRFYGVLAGLITAIAVLIYQGGGLGGS